MTEIPAGAKKPQDHQLKKKSAAQLEAENSDILVEYAGETYTIERDVVNDVELLELIADMTTNPILLSKVVRTILGVKQWAKFKDNNRNESGRVPAKHLHELFDAIDTAVGKSAASPTS